MGEQETERYRVTFEWLLRSLPASWQPRDDAEREAFVRCSPAVRFAVRRAATDPAPMLNAKGDWAAFDRRLQAAHGRTGATALKHALKDVGDMVLAFEEQVVRPACDLVGMRVPAATPERRNTFQTLFSGRSVCRILEGSRLWHDRQGVILAAMPGTAPRGGWPAILPDADLRDVGGVVIRVLTTPAELADEGARGNDGDGLPGLWHCVGGHAGRCLDGTSRILSIRAVEDGAELRLSTAEVTWRRGVMTVSQHRGPCNAAPPVMAVMALRTYVDGMGHGTLRPTAPDLPRHDGAHASRAAPHRCGYDWRIPGAWETVRDAWRPHLPPGLRDVGSRALAEHARHLVGHGGRDWASDPVRLGRPAADGLDARLDGPHHG